MERMDCPAARRFLEQGMRPGSSPPDRAALGFHLAGCPSCRAYRAQLDDSLLSSLLAAAQPQPLPAPTPAAAASKTTAAASAPSRTWRAPLSQALWYGSLGLLAAFLLA